MIYFFRVSVIFDKHKNEFHIRGFNYLKKCKTNEELLNLFKVYAKQSVNKKSKILVFVPQDFHRKIISDVLNSTNYEGKEYISVVSLYPRINLKDSDRLYVINRENLGDLTDEEIENLNYLHSRACKFFNFIRKKEQGINYLDELHTNNLISSITDSGQLTPKEQK